MGAIVHKWLFLSKCSDKIELVLKDFLLQKSTLFCNKELTGFFQSIEHDNEMLIKAYHIV